ncbi:9666_t:CDS:2, partial [Acaulospora morrowiae]
KVNRSISFVNLNGTHTNMIEGTWRGLKIRIQPRYRGIELIEKYLLEFIWRRKHENNLWQGLLDALLEIVSRIFNHIDDPKDFQVLSRVSKEWKQVLDHHSFWEYLT